MINYGSCSLFSSHELWTQTLKKIFLPFEVEINAQNSDNQTEDDLISDDFILADSYCAVAPDESSPESAWFINVKDPFESAVERISCWDNQWLRKCHYPWSPL